MSGLLCVLFNIDLRYLLKETDTTVRQMHIFNYWKGNSQQKDSPLELAF